MTEQVCSRCNGRKFIQHPAFKDYSRQVVCPDCQGTGKTTAQEYIALVETEAGHYYIGPDADVAAIIRAAKADIDFDPHSEALDECFSPITQAYVWPYNEETCMPDSDADPIWMWTR